MPSARLIRILLCSVFLSPLTYADEPLIVKHYQQHTRYEFGLKVLDLALSKLNQPYKVIGPKSQVVNEARGEALVLNGHYDLEFLSATPYRESKMIPIRVPIYQGLLGLRLLLIKPSLNAKIKKVDSLKELQKYIGGHGLHWADLPVYAANNLKVVTSVEYEKLFEMLKAGRFDYFHRGANEIWGELERYSDDLIIADNIMLFYPQPVYFFVSKHRPELAKKLEQGLQKAIEDGSYKALFLSNYKEIISRAELPSRTLITLNNPGVPNNMPPIDTSWWMPQGKFLP